MPTSDQFLPGKTLLVYFELVMFTIKYRQIGQDCFSITSSSPLFIQVIGNDSFILTTDNLLQVELTGNAVFVLTERNQRLVEEISRLIKAVQVHGDIN